MSFLFFFFKKLSEKEKGDILFVKVLGYDFCGKESFKKWLNVLDILFWWIRKIWNKIY